VIIQTTFRRHVCRTTFLQHRERAIAGLQLLGRDEDEHVDDSGDVDESFVNLLAQPDNQLVAATNGPRFPWLSGVYRDRNTGMHNVWIRRKKGGKKEYIISKEEEEHALKALEIAIAKLQEQPRILINPWRFHVEHELDQFLTLNIN
jgi:hypothetical protein